MTTKAEDILKIAKDLRGSLSPDMVHHPPHYNQGEIECIDAIKAALGHGFPAYCRGNALKYIWRAEYKGNRDQDIKKAIWYLKESLEEEESALPF